MIISIVLGLKIYQEMTNKERSVQLYLKELEITHTCEDFLELIIENIDQHSAEITLNSHVIDLLKKETLEQNGMVMDILNDWMIKNTGVKSIHILNLKGESVSASEITSNSMKKKNCSNQFSLHIFENLNDKAGESYIGIANDYVGSEYARTLYMAKRINDKTHLEALGYIFYLLDMDFVQEKLDEYLERNNFEVVLIDKGGNAFNFGASRALYETYTKYMNGQLTGREKKNWEKEYSYAEVKNNELDIRFIGRYIERPKNNNLINVMLAFCIINLIFLTIITVCIRRVVLTPLEQISNVANRISEEGTLSTRFEISSKYREGYIIAGALNKMLDKIKTLIKESNERERQKQVLELSLINHQVNPHFLFNTLNSVSFLISVEDKNTALKLVKGLAKYYRACLTQENTMNTVEQELAIMWEYVHIIELKNPDLIDLSVEVDADTHNKKMPRMIMQTLVENSIKYGIKTMDEPLEIKMHVEADYENNRTILTIRDNGKGMEDEIKQNIMQGIRLENKSGFGLKSTIQRISLLYQIQNISEIIEIDSKINEYTIIKFFIPW